jgi:SAM-dependent methyltransferase
VDETQESRLAARRSRLMHALALRWEPELGTWAYDDSDVGVYGEPFVLGADAMLTQLRALQLGPGLDPSELCFPHRNSPAHWRCDALKKKTAGCGTRRRSAIRCSVVGYVGTSLTTSRPRRQPCTSRPNRWGDLPALWRMGGKRRSTSEYKLRMSLEPSNWYLDELRHAGPEHLDPTYVGGYDEKSPTDWREDLAALQALGIGPTSTVVDFGAGTGAFARAVAPHVGRVIAVDVSEAMVALMRQQGIEAINAGFLSYEHSGDPPDAVFTRNALHHLPDFWKATALERIARLLRPGGVLRLRDIVYSFEPAAADDAVSSWLAAAPTDASQGWTAPQLAEHLRDEHSTFTWLLEPMLEHVGFEIRERWLSPNGIYAAYTCTTR